MWAMDQRKAYAQTTGTARGTRGKTARKLVFSQASFQSARLGGRGYDNNNFVAPRKKPEQADEQEEIEPEVIQRLFEEEF